MIDFLDVFNKKVFIFLFFCGMVWIVSNVIGLFNLSLWGIFIYGINLCKLCNCGWCLVCWVVFGCMEVIVW